MNYADIKEIDIQDGEGVRVSLYVSGCHFHCKGCHNKEAWDFNYGKKFTQETINKIINLLDKPYIRGLSILGGEPLEPINQIGLVDLVSQVKEKFPQKTIWCWTGYDFERDIFEKMYKENEYTRNLLKNIDIIVDGEFQEENKLVNLKFRGSTNQKMINVRETLEKGSVVRLRFGDEARYENKQPKVIVIEEYKKQKVQEDENYSKNIDVRSENFVSENKDNKIEILKLEEKISAKSNNLDSKEEL